MNSNILNSEGVHIAVVLGPDIFDLTGKKIYNLKSRQYLSPVW